MSQKINALVKKASVKEAFIPEAKLLGNMMTEPIANIGHKIEGLGGKLGQKSMDAVAAKKEGIKSEYAPKVEAAENAYKNLIFTMQQAFSSYYIARNFNNICNVFELEMLLKNRNLIFRVSWIILRINISNPQFPYILLIVELKIVVV